MLRKDSRDELEIIVAKISNDIHKIYEPVDSTYCGNIFHAAVQEGAPNCLRFLLSKASDEQINRPDKNGLTALHYTCLESSTSEKIANLSCLKSLVSSRAFVNARDNSGNTCLHILAKRLIEDKENGNDIVLCAETLLRSRYINPNSKNCLQMSPKDICLHEVKTDKNSKEFCRLLDNYKETSTINKYYERSQKEALIEKITGTLLSFETYDKIANKILLLIKDIKSSNFVDNRYIGTKTLLYLVTEHLGEHLLKSFLELNLSPWIPNIDDGRLPLHAALSKNDYISTALILQHMNNYPHEIQYYDHYSFSLLQTCLCCAKPKASQSLQQCLQSLLKIDGIRSSVNQSLEENAISVQITDNLSIKDRVTEITALTLARWAKNKEAQELLLLNGAFEISPPSADPSKYFSG